MKATEQCFPVVLFILQYKVVPSFEFMDEIMDNSVTEAIEQYVSMFL